jgi:hypothetical protein
MLMEHIANRVALSFVGALAGICTLLLLLVTYPLGYAMQKLAVISTRLERAIADHARASR